MMVSRPGDRRAKKIDDQVMEPVEHLSIDVPENFVGTVIERLGPRKGEMTKMVNHGSGRVRMEFRIPQPRADQVALGDADRDPGYHHHEFDPLDGYIAYQGEISASAPPGALISDRQGNDDGLCA